MKLSNVLFLIICVFQFNLKVFAEVLYKNHTPYNTNRVKNNINETQNKQQEEWKKSHLEKYGISCFENPNSADCLYLDTKIERVYLKSYLAKYHRAYKVILKNKSDKRIEVIDLHGYDNPATTISNLKAERAKNRFPISLKYYSYIPYAPLWVVMLPAVPLMFMMPPDEETVVFAGGPIYWIGAGTWYTIASPLYYFKDKKDDKLANKELSTMLQSNKIKLKPSDEITFIMLSGYKPRLYVQYKKEDEGNIIKIRYDDFKTNN